VTGEEVAELLLDLAEGDLASRRNAVVRLAACGEPAVPALVRFLAGDSGSDARWYAASALALIGPPSIGPLVAAIGKNTDVQFRRYAAAALGHIGEPAVRPLLAALKTEDPVARGFLRRPCAGSARTRSRFSRRSSGPQTRRCASMQR